MSTLLMLRVTLPSLRPWLTEALAFYRRFRPHAQVDLEEVIREADQMVRDLVGSDLEERLGAGRSVCVMTGGAAVSWDATPRDARLAASPSGMAPEAVVLAVWNRASESALRRCTVSHMPL